jgi:hypothetical protein
MFETEATFQLPMASLNAEAANVGDSV